MKIRIYNARILTMREGEELLPGELHIEGEKITYVGQKPENERDDWDREIDAQKNLILPGFKDAHTHSAMVLFRSYADDLPLSDWLNKKIFPLEAKLTPEYVYWATRLACLEYLSSGITACFDMYMKNEANAKAAVDSGFRMVLCGSINDYGGTVPEIEKEYLHFNAYDPLISYQLGFHAEYTTARSIMEDMAALSHKYKAPVYLHNSETEGEVAGCIKRYGKTPTAFLDSLGMFDFGGGGFHCVYMTTEDLSICKNRGIYVVTNPSSNLKLASGIAPIKEMASLGLNLAIGTDGAASNNCLDMFREMFLVTGLQKVLTKDAAAMDAKEVLKMATVGGAAAMGLTDCDVLSAGKNADLVMIDLHRPNMQPINNITKNLVYSGSKENVKMTMIAGKILYENGKFFVDEDTDKIYGKVNEAINAMREA